MNNLHLVVGEEEFLAERARRAIVQAAQGDHVDVTFLPAKDITESELVELFSPSLFAEDRIVVLTKMEEAGKEATELIMSAAVALEPTVTLVLMHSGGGRNKQVLTKLRKIANVQEVSSPKPQERMRWVTAEFRVNGVTPTPDVVQALLECVGSDLRELSSAVGQLVADTGGDVSVEKVHEYYVGVAEVSGFDVADLACSGQVRKAVASMRRAIQLGVEPVALAAVLSMKISAIARLYSHRGHLDKYALAGELRMPAFVVEKTASIARRWSGDSVSKAVIIAADLDAGLKSGGNREFLLENAIRQVAELAA